MAYPEYGMNWKESTDQLEKVKSVNLNWTSTFISDGNDHMDQEYPICVRKEVPTASVECRDIEQAYALANGTQPVASLVLEEQGACNDDVNKNIYTCTRAFITSLGRNGSWGELSSTTVEISAESIVLTPSV